MCLRQAYGKTLARLKMAVSEKMVDALTESVKYINGNMELNPYEGAQEVINAAWNEFDYEDSDIWPQTYKPFLVKFKTGNWQRAMLTTQQTLKSLSGIATVKLLIIRMQNIYYS